MIWQLLQARQSKGRGTGKSNTDPNMECYNCHKKGHMSKDCWGKGGSKEGQGFKGQKGSKPGTGHKLGSE